MFSHKYLLVLHWQGYKCVGYPCFFYFLLYGVCFLILKIQHSHVTACKICLRKNHSLKCFVLNVNYELVCPWKGCVEDMESVIVQNSWTLTRYGIHCSVDLVLNLMLGHVDFYLNVAVQVKLIFAGILLLNLVTHHKHS